MREYSIIIGSYIFINAVSLHFMYYNFAWIHHILRVTPAMEAGVIDHVWGLEEIAALADEL